MSHEFRIKPLSEGLGLGSLRTPQSSRFQSQDQNDLPAIEIHAQERAHQIYRQQSVGTAKKKTLKTRSMIWMAQALVGWGLDAFMVVMTVFMCSVLGVMAWHMGAGITATLDPVDALRTIAGFVSRRGIGFAAGGMALAGLFYWAVMKAVVGTTMGTALTRRSK